MVERTERDELGAIARELSQIARSGKVLPGSITERRMRCGRSGCGCHADPPRLHGPYWQWTRKLKQKTLGRYLSDKQAASYEPWIENDRRMRELLSRLEQIGIERLEAEHRPS